MGGIMPPFFMAELVAGIGWRFYNGIWGSFFAINFSLRSIQVFL